MTEINKIKLALSTHKEELKKEYGVKDIGIFGSYARNEQKSKSDIDVLVNFNKKIGLLKFVDLQYRLQRLLKMKVDLVMKSALKPNIGKSVFKEVIYL